VTYVCAEPDTNTVFIDNAGGHHADRDSAIDASFMNDVTEAVELGWEE